MDNLDRDIREAQRLGYGVHYGHYKADHPYTADHSVDLVPEYPVKKCAECGEEFVPGRPGQIYCSEECRNRRNARESARKNRENRPKSPIGPAVCPVCGCTFHRERADRIYCGMSCAAVARNKRRKGEKRKKHPIKWETSSEG